MVRTRVGYAGGVELAPTYRKMGSHTEAIQVVYDPEVIEYAVLLETFWAGHRPVQEAYSRQYRSVIFVTGPEEREAAAASLEKRSVELGRPLFTAIEPAAVFWPAEDYHQKYRLRRNQSVVRVLAERFGAAWIDTTAAARLNAVLGGYAITEPLEAWELPAEVLAVVRSRSVR